jgi:hypothetical protein
MHGFGSHTFKMVNKQHEAVYVKFHYKVHHLLHTFYCHHKFHCLVYIKHSQLMYIHTYIHIYIHESNIHVSGLDMEFVKSITQNVLRIILQIK